MALGCPPSPPARPPLAPPLLPISSNPIALLSPKLSLWRDPSFPSTYPTRIRTPCPVQFHRCNIGMMSEVTGDRSRAGLLLATMLSLAGETRRAAPDAPPPTHTHFVFPEPPIASSAPRVPPPTPSVSAACIRARGGGWVRVLDERARKDPQHFFHRILANPSSNQSTTTAGCALILIAPFGLS